MHWLYTFFIYLITPLLLLLLVLRGLRNRNWLHRWSERFGWFDPPRQKGGIIVHAVSVGEVNAASALIRSLTQRFPGRPLCLTTFTPTGSDRAQGLLPGELFHVYAPLDLPGAVNRFFDRVRPCLLIIMETEIWPNLYRQAYKRGIPVMIANARISKRSFRGYRRMKRLTTPVLSQVSCIAAQSELDAGRLLEIGAVEEQLVTSGNLKFDVALPVGLPEQGVAIRRTWGDDRFVFVAGSTHEGEEGPVLEAFIRLLGEFPDALLVLAPRHPERFGRVASLVRASGLTASLHSERANCTPSTRCLIVDTMGELLFFYAACDVAFVGGSLEPVGGHNALEPAALAKPVLLGPHCFNFEEVTMQLLNAGAALRVNNAEELAAAIARLFKQSELRDQMGRAGLELVKSNQGALERTLEIVRKLIG